MWVWAALLCYNASCYPPVARIEPPPPRIRCPEEFRAKNYAQSSGGKTSWSVVCAEDGPFVYGGISFYDGEGITGIGGLLRLERATRKIEVRRVPLLRDVSINAIAVDSDIVWFGTTRNQECAGQPFAHGLVRYDWRTRDTKTWEGSDDGPIGFVIGAIAVRDASVWVETELGLSRFDGTWHHFDVNRRERTAREIIEPLLRTIPRDCLRTDDYDNQLVAGLQLFRPRLLEELSPQRGRRGRRPSSPPSPLW